MIHLHLLTEFSHTHCIAICAFLVPAILLLTLTTITLTGLQYRQAQILPSAGLATLCGVAMIFHVFSWFAVGVIAAPTFILLYMATTCTILNGWAIARPRSMTQLVGNL
jgi:hypothetical protein